MIDAMIPLGPNDGDTVELTARSVKRFVEGVRNVYVVSREDPRLPGVTFVPEESFPFDLETVRRALGEHDRAGWYLQQLIKLYFPLAVSGSLDQVLVVDADTIFLRTCRFVEDGRTVLNFGDEYHAPYFAHMARLHPALRKMFAYSGVSHCMLLTRSWLLELLGAVDEANAWQRAIQLGPSLAEQYINAEGNPVVWTFERVLEVQVILEDQLDDGVEVFHRFLCEDEVKSLAQPLSEP